MNLLTSITQEIMILNVFVVENVGIHEDSDSKVTKAKQEKYNICEAFSVDYTIYDHNYFDENQRRHQQFYVSQKDCM